MKVVVSDSLVTLNFYRVTIVFLLDLGVTDVAAVTSKLTQRKACRLTDQATGGLQNFSPIFGLAKTPETVVFLIALN